MHGLTWSLAAVACVLAGLIAWQGRRGD
jgi:hypothetical protein